MVICGGLHFQNISMNMMTLPNNGMKNTQGGMQQLTESQEAIKTNNLKKMNGAQRTIPKEKKGATKPRRRIKGMRRRRNAILV